MEKRYIINIIFLCIVILWAGNFTSYNVTAIEEKKVIVVDWGTIEPTSTPCHYEIDLDFERVENIEYVSPVPTPTPTPTPTPALTTLVESNEWLCYLATSYHTSPGECGNRGDDLSNKNVIAMWQTDTDYAKSCVEPFKTFYQTHNAEDFGGLPYGTKVEMRYWTGTEYRDLGTYEVLDTSYTTIYALSEVAQSLSSSKNYVHFSYEWPSINYKGVRQSNAGTKWGHASNWKQDYNGKIIGWLDVLNADWGMVIIEIRVIH